MIKYVNDDVMRSILEDLSAPVGVGLEGLRIHLGSGLVFEYILYPFLDLSGQLWNYLQTLEGVDQLLNPGGPC